MTNQGVFVVLCLDFDQWLGVAQVLGTIVATFFAWRAVVVANDARKDARAEQRRSRLERLRVAVGELERQTRVDVPTVQKEVQQERVLTLLPSLGGIEAFPETAKLAHWDATLGGAEGVADAAVAEVDKAINESFGQAG